MPLVIALAVVATTSLAPFQDRADANRSVERARYSFRLRATRPFDEAYPRKVFEVRVAREQAEEDVLEAVFGWIPTAEDLQEELARIEGSTREPDQWVAIKAALGDDATRIEETVCRPLVVSRALRVRFAFDRDIQAVPHREVRMARAQLRARLLPPAARRLRLGAEHDTMTTDRWLEQAKADARQGSQSAAPAPVEGEQAEPLPAELESVLERELREPGDVTTVLEWPDRFEVFRLVSRQGSTWTVEAVRVPKRDFDQWFAEQRRSLHAPPAVEDASR